jgi:hypothetical protein
VPLLAQEKDSWFYSEEKGSLVCSGTTVGFARFAAR